MNHLIKSWLPPGSGTKKFLAADLAHRLSRIINRRQFEVVLEGYIDLHNVESEQPDIVVYDKGNNLQSALIIELCDSQNLVFTIHTLEILLKIYGLNESFVYNYEQNCWLRISADQQVPVEDSYSVLFKTDLNDLIAHESRFNQEVA